MLESGELFRGLEKGTVVKQLPEKTFFLSYVITLLESFLLPVLEALNIKTAI